MNKINKDNLALQPPSGRNPQIPNGYEISKNLALSYNEFKSVQWTDQVLIEIGHLIEQNKLLNVDHKS